MMVAIVAVTASALFATSAFAASGQSVAGEQVAVASDPSTMTAAIIPGAGREARVVPLPKPLSTADADAYSQAFRLGAQGRWAAAEKEAERASDPLLLGHVLARRYLDKSTHASTDDIQSWMETYADLPQAEALYHLISAKGAAAGVNQPVRGTLKETSVDTSDDGSNWEATAFNVDLTSSLGRSLKQKLHAVLRRDNDDQAVGILREAMLHGLPKLDQDELKLMVAFHNYGQGRSDLAASLAADVAARSGDDFPAAYWVAGLAEWRRGRPDKAKVHFEHLAEAPNSTGWMMAAGAFWAARSNLVTHHPEVVNHWLEIAATYPRTFYGLLSRRILGYETLFSNSQVPFTQVDADILMRSPGGRRALALLQIGDSSTAEDELRKSYPHAGKALRQSILAMAQNGDMPELAVRLGGLSPDSASDASAYPLPNWTPLGGWHMDRALVLAFARQESRFDPNVHSPRGAVGLMQLMPATAAVLGGSRSRERLTNPEYNLALGQKYLAKLLGENLINGNLFYLAAAYNAGPGKLAQWVDAFGRNDDPLLFVESLPSRETRAFVERIMTNYWIYRGRLGQASGSLDQIASGKWPTYDSLDKAPKLRDVSTR